MCPFPGSMTPVASSATRLSPPEPDSCRTASATAPAIATPAATSSQRERRRARPGNARAEGRSRSGSWRSIASLRPRSSGPGSSPTSSSRTRRACRNASNASAWRPQRYIASIRWPCSRSRNGYVRTRSSSSPNTAACRPSASSLSISASRARSQRSSRRRISGAANGSSARSSRGGPRHSASASRTCEPFSPDVTRRSKCNASTASGSTRSS